MVLAVDMKVLSVDLSKIIFFYLLVTEWNRTETILAGLLKNLLKEIAVSKLSVE